MMRKTALLLSLLAGAVSLPHLLPGAGEEADGRYVEVEVVGGGWLTGRVLAPDPPPPHGDHVVTQDERICGRRIADERLLVSDSGAVKNAIVSIEGILRGKPVDLLQRRRLVNTGCRFVPHVIGASVGQKIEIVNGDPLLHHTHAKLDGRTTVFQVDLPVQNQKIPRVLGEPGILKVECDAGHPWMSAWIHAFEHPYFAITGDTGTFVIEGIPPGSYRVKAWHEELGTEVLEVTIPRGGGTKLEFSGLARVPR